MWRIISDPVIPAWINRSEPDLCPHGAPKSVSVLLVHKSLQVSCNRHSEGRNGELQYSRIIINDQNRFWCVPVHQAESGNSRAMICRIWVNQDA
jgi:hypothetical protein